MFAEASKGRQTPKLAKSAKRLAEIKSDFPGTLQRPGRRGDGGRADSASIDQAPLLRPLLLVSIIARSSPTPFPLSPPSPSAKKASITDWLPLTPTRRHLVQRALRRSRRLARRTTLRGLKI